MLVVLLLAPVHQPLLHDLTARPAVGVPERPFLKPWYRLAAADGRLVLEYAHRAVVLEGEAATRLLPALLPLLDGTRTVEEIVCVLGEAVRPAVANALLQLAGRGLLTEPFAGGEPARPAAETARFIASVSRRGTSPPQAAQVLAQARVAVCGDGAAAAEVGRLLRLSGVGELDRSSLEDGPGAADLVLAVPSSAELPTVGCWNRTALEAGMPWLALLPFDGRFTAVGPLFIPGESCCYECYRIRRASNLGYWDEFWPLEEVGAERPAAPAAVAGAAGLAVMVALRWLVEADPELPGVVFALVLDGSPALAAHHVYRVPRCPCCSEAARVAAVLPWYERDEGGE